MNYARALTFQHLCQVVNGLLSDAPLPRKRGGKALTDLALRPAPDTPGSLQEGRAAVPAGAMTPGSVRGAGTGASSGQCPGIVNGTASSALKHILFVGQLGYDVTVTMISKHFAACAPGQKIKVRLLTHKETGKSRGIAFVEMPDAESGERGLLLDHSVLDGRRIRVEPTAKGSGNTASRQDAIKSLKQQHEQDQRQHVTQVLDAAFAEYGLGKGERAKIHRSDVDDGVMEFLCTIPMVLVEKAVAEAVELDVGTIRNKSAYLMGFLKIKVAQLSEDPANLKVSSDAGGTGKGRCGREEGHESAHKGAHHAHRKESGGGGEAEERSEAAPGDGAATSNVARVDFFSAEPLKRKRLVPCRVLFCGGMDLGFKVQGLGCLPFCGCVGVCVCGGVDAPDILSMHSCAHGAALLDM